MNTLKIDENLKQYLIETNTRLFGGLQYVFKFPNKFGASVINGFGASTGNDGNLWEIALLAFGSDNDYILYYEERGEKFYDVLGYQTNEQINRLLKEIMERKPLPN